MVEANGFKPTSDDVELLENGFEKLIILVEKTFMWLPNFPLLKVKIIKWLGFFFIRVEFFMRIGWLPNSLLLKERTSFFRKRKIEWPPDSP